MQGYHNSILLNEILGYLEVGKNWYIDGTLGDGGHSLSIIKAGGKIFGIDADPEALKRVEVRFKDLGIDKSAFRLNKGNYSNLKGLIEKSDLKANFKGLLLDLGVSSLQLDDPIRGFSLNKLGPLDMRMDPELSVSALDLINGLNKGELYELFTKLGEETYANRIVDALVRARQIAPITKTTQLAFLVEKAVGRKGKIHPATKIFQALRIAVNDELNGLREILPQALEVLDSGGVICIISFHSLEDRIVKNMFKDFEKEGLGEIITKKPIIPSLEEIASNPRSRSAKLRVFKKS